MALDLSYNEATRNARLDAVDAQIGTSGKLRIYDGTMPATAEDTIPGDADLLADLALSATAFAAASGGTMVANSISDDTSADATGTATWFTLTKSDNTRVVDGTVGTSGTDMIIDNASITAGQTVSCSGITITGGNVGS